MKRWIEQNISEEVVSGVLRIELFRVAAEQKLIEDVELWMTFHRGRNLSSHTYNENNAINVLEIALSFLIPVKKLLKRMETHNG